ncbi:TssN family type VI secretion system protein [Chryseobacterium sp. JJR-5R]|uniref:TssN family type VI secretion system protein n=1 Tax=Chryseobacterium sp. JJR-5R TaxID=3093923 RepID=UPI002A7590DC|nr:TssN family type VI secretion system protein [Chryseobacterium sp. JJR-5R]WPO81044.1 TssN family type VI secretion system protein [Chryseobacterium sp. JJR-5R]
MEISSVKGIFLRYILMPLFAVIMMVILSAIRRSQPAIKIRTIIIYVLLCSLCLAIPGISGFTGNLFNPYWYLIAQIVYLILGIIHVNLSDRYFKKHFTSLTKSILFESVLTITCIGFGGYLFYLIFNLMSNSTGYPVMAATSIFIFAVPLVFHYCYIQLISIPVDIYKTWRYSPEQRLPDFEGADFDRLMVLNVELSKNLEDANRFRIKAKTLPTGITFGDWFYRVVDDYNHKNPNSIIHLSDQVREPYYWIFYTKKSFFSFRKYIDFDQDITQNSISENDVVICKRVIQHEEEGIKRPQSTTV